MIFLPEHEPRVLGTSNFYLLKGDSIAIAGGSFEHHLFQFRLYYYGWFYVEMTTAAKALFPYQKCSS